MLYFYHICIYHIEGISYGTLFISRAFQFPSISQYIPPFSEYLLNTYIAFNNAIIKGMYERPDSN
jgi:hypothetical protein